MNANGLVESDTDRIVNNYSAISRDYNKTDLVKRDDKIHQINNEYSDDDDSFEEVSHKLECPLCHEMIQSNQLGDHVLSHDFDDGSSSDSDGDVPYSASEILAEGVEEPVKEPQEANEDDQNEEEGSQDNPNDEGDLLDEIFSSPMRSRKQSNPMNLQSILPELPEVPVVRHMQNLQAIQRQ